ncbi:hypothetical protein RhiJN_16421 [Ceratobasidium sp. AG-Ba]|nr:hypothetical protein RhiJN_16421 [Ceratobasidium sp. AG-Ba]
MHGLGRVDAEGCERAWADVNQAARSLAKKGEGFYADSLNNNMHDSNWRKLITIVTFVLYKHDEAVKMAAQTEDDWKDFNAFLPESKTTEWATLSTEPYQDHENGNKWTSVFIAKEGAAVSTTCTVLELNKLEQIERQKQNKESSPELDTGDANGLTGPSWTSEGLDLEYQQHRLSQDLRKIGSDPTDRQSLDLFNRRSSLSSRIICHRQQAVFFLDIKPSQDSVTGSLAEETDGRPEKARLYLPSRLGSALVATDRSRKAEKLEYTLRRATCLQAVHRIRVATIQKKQATRSKRRNARGEIMNTRSQAAIDRLGDRVDLAVWEYKNSYKALTKLKLTEEDSKILRPVSKPDLDELWKFLDLDRATGEGYKKAPWLWILTGSEAGSASESSQVVEKEIDEANRVEWFRGRERYRRWQEEVLWLEREAASIVLDFQSRSEYWERLSHSNHAGVNAGYQSYCVRQRDVWFTMRQDAKNRLHELLKEGDKNNIVLCQRVLGI